MYYDRVTRLVAVSVLALAVLATSASADVQSTTLDRCVRAGPQTKIIRFRSPGRHRTPAAILGTGTVGVVLSNQGDNDLCRWLPFARRLVGGGVRVLVYDYRWGTEPAEARAAVAALRRRGVKRVALAGASLGAAASLVAGATKPRGAVGVVSLSGVAYAMVGVRSAVRRLTLPVLFVAAEADEFSAGPDAREFYASAPSKDKKLIVVPGTAHGTDLLADATIRQTVADWLVAHLRPAPTA